MTNRARDRGLILYCGLGGLAYYPRPGHGVEMDRFLDRCAEAGVAELVFYFGFVLAGEPTIVRLVPPQGPFDSADLLATFHLYEPGGWDPWAALVHGASARGLPVRRVLGPGQHLSVAVDDSPEQAQTRCYDWPGWTTAGLVDRVVLRHRGQNLAQMATRVRRARALLGSRVELVSQLDCWRADGLRDGTVLCQVMEGVRGAGADWVGIYRADAVEALGLWQHIGS